MAKQQYKHPTEKDWWHPALPPGHYPAGIRTGRVPGSTPYRLFYPADPASASKCAPASWWDRGLGAYNANFMHAFIRNKWLALLASWFSRLVARWIPAAAFTIPNLYWNAPPAALSGRSLPLILFSHGLMGTTEENTLLLTRWAQKGYVVVTVQHMDGSSPRVQLPDGTERFFHHVSYKPYDKSLRTRQVAQRQSELAAARTMALSSSSEEAFPSQVQRLIDPAQCVAAGFSYGATTACLEVFKNPDNYRACILLDPWFHLQVPSINFFQEFPSEVHGESRGGLQVPACFILSEQFDDHMFGIAKRLCANSAPDSEYHVLPATAHQNFIETYFWFGTNGMTTYVGKVQGTIQGDSALIGSCDPCAMHSQLVNMTLEYMARRGIVPPPVPAS